MITRFVFPLLLLAGGVVFLLFVKDAPRIRGTEANFGWLLLGLGAALLVWEWFKSRRTPEPPPTPPEGHGRLS